MRVREDRQYIRSTDKYKTRLYHEITGNRYNEKVVVKKKTLATGQPSNVDGASLR